MADPVEALRSESGLRLVLFVAEKRRAALPADRRLADLSPAEVDELRQRATSLTDTEALLEREVERWIVQQTGPAWAEPSEASAELCGLLFTRLDGSGERRRVAGRPPGPLPGESELRRLLAATEPADDDEPAGGDESLEADESVGGGGGAAAT